MNMYILIQFTIHKTLHKTIFTLICTFVQDQNKSIIGL